MVYEMQCEMQLKKEAIVSIRGKELKKLIAVANPTNDVGFMNEVSQFKVLPIGFFCYAFNGLLTFFILQIC